MRLLVDYVWMNIPLKKSQNIKDHIFLKIIIYRFDMFDKTYMNTAIEFDTENIHSNIFIALMRTINTFLSLF